MANLLNNLLSLDISNQKSLEALSFFEQEKISQESAALQQNRIFLMKSKSVLANYQPLYEKISSVHFLFIFIIIFMRSRDFLMIFHTRLKKSNIFLQK